MNQTKERSEHKHSMHNQTIEALLSLAWKKERKERPKWVIKELKKYC